MMMSPLLSSPASVSIVSSVILPCGSITQTVFGEPSSFLTRSANPVAAVAPSFPRPSTAAGFASQTTEVCPPFMSRREILAPIRPSPTTPICIRSSSVAVRPFAPHLASGTTCHMLPRWQGGARWRGRAGNHADVMAARASGFQVRIPVQEVEPGPVQVLPRDIPLGRLVDLVRRRFGREAQQLHPGLRQRAATLEQIVPLAARHDVGPTGDTALAAWHHVVEREVLGRQRRAAILATESVSQKHMVA